MLQENRQTNKWRLKGATYLEENTFHFVGDYINDQFQLSFDVNGDQKQIVVPEPLKSLGVQTDEIKNGIIHYNIKALTIDQHTVLAIDHSWIQGAQTAICYCHMPYDALGNTLILCDKLNVVSAMITKTEDCGIKIINKILAIRLNKAQLNITPGDSAEDYITKFNAYLKDHPFTILYSLAQPISWLLEDYGFNIQNADNDITCVTQYEPSYFNVDYPVDVVINTTVDVKEVQLLAQEIRETKLLIDEIKIDLDDKSVLIAKQYDKVLEIELKVNAQMSQIESIRKEVAQSNAQVTEALNQIKQLKTEMDTLATEIREIAHQVATAVTQHNLNNESHQDIRALITQSGDTSSNKIEQHNLNTTTHQDIRNLITNHQNASDAHQDIRNLITRIDYDFGEFF